MKVRNLLIASLAVLGLVAFTAGTASAFLVGVNIEVFKNGISQGTAFGGASTSTNTPLIVTAATGDTLRFVVMFNTPDNGTFSTAITADANNSAGGGAEMRYVAGSGVLLMPGASFGTLTGNPNNSLNDTTPTTGNGNTSGVNGTSTTNMYRVDYVVQTVVTDTIRDFTVVMTAHASDPPANLIDSQTDTASVRIDAAAVTVPEPATLLLLGSGLAGLAGFGRKKLRK